MFIKTTYGTLLNTRHIISIYPSNRERNYIICATVTYGENWLGQYDNEETRDAAYASLIRLLESTETVIDINAL